MSNLNISSLTLDKIPGILDILYKIKDPALILGAPGVGKSEAVKQWAEEKGFNLITRMLAEIQPGDLMIPTKDEENNCLSYLIINWLKDLPTDKPTVFFFDELPSATIEVRTQIYELLLNRRIGGYQLPKDCFVIAAGNRVTDGASAMEIDAALADRVNIMNIECSAEIWINWAIENNIHPAVLTFITNRPEYLLDENSISDLVKYTPRSWAKVSEVLYAMNIEDPDSAIDIIQGRVGIDTAIIFIETLRDILDLPSFKDLVSLGDDEIKMLSPSKLNQLWGLCYSAKSWSTNKKNLAQAFRILSLMCEGSALEMKQEVLKTGVQLLLSYSVSKNWFYDLLETEIYEKYIAKTINETIGWDTYNKLYG